MTQRQQVVQLPLNTMNARRGHVKGSREERKDVVASRKGVNAAAKAVEELDAAAALTSLVDSSPQLQPKDPEKQETELVEYPEKYTRSGRRKATPFPYKLMKLLSSNKHTDIITWCKDGKAFSILRPRIFTKKLLPIHFKEAKFSSFTRKLHRWGFQRHLRGPNTGAFFHKDFVRNRVDLLEKMTCHHQKYPTSSSKETSSTTTDKPVVEETKAEDKLHSVVPSRQSRPRVSSLEESSARHLANTSEGTASSKLGAPAESALPSSPSNVMRGPRDLGSMRQANRRKILESESLDVAIELEVTRRLRERMTAAALSRQALAEMESRHVHTQALNEQLRLRAASLADRTTRLSAPTRLGGLGLPSGALGGLEGIVGNRNGHQLGLGLNSLPRGVQSNYASTHLRTGTPEDVVLRKAVEALGHARDIKDLIR